MWWKIFFLVWWLLAFLPPIKIRGKLPRGYAACAIVPFIIYEKMDKSIYKHEMEHIKQQRLFSPFGFLFAYCMEYLHNRFSGMEHFNAYYNISFEVKARRAERK